MFNELTTIKGFFLFLHKLLEIFILSFENALKTVTDLVNDFQARDKNYLSRKCETLDKQIDELVYQLYGLTDEEIKIVEGN
jgi:type II restriction/modification system DNA methylase subunit YeeA